MIVDRRTAIVKPGCMDKIIALIKENTNGEVSVCRPIVGSMNRIVMEIRFHNMAERSRYWESWLSRPEQPRFKCKWEESVVDDTIELWEVV